MPRSTWTWIHESHPTPLTLSFIHRTSTLGEGRVSSDDKNWVCPASEQGKNVS